MELSGDPAELPGRYTRTRFDRDSLTNAVPGWELEGQPCSLLGHHG